MTTTKIETLGITAITADGTFSAKLGGDMVTIDGWALPGGFLPCAPVVKGCAAHAILRDLEESLPAGCLMSRGTCGAGVEPFIGCATTLYRIDAACSCVNADGTVMEESVSYLVGFEQEYEESIDSECIRVMESVFLESLGWDVWGLVAIQQ